MKIIVITGQTASGKTGLGLKLAKKNNGVLINADARQIYKHLDIVTGKDHPDKVLLYDIVDPKSYFSSFDYQKEALPVIKKVLDEGKTPIIIGGTYLYLSHLLYRVDTENIPPDWNLRQKLNNKSLSELQKTLHQINPQYFEALNNSEKNNPQRLIRKIEIFSRDSLKRLSESKKYEIKIQEKLDFKKIDVDFYGLKFANKSDLIDAIKKRVETRIKNGAIKEVENLLKKNYNGYDPGLKTIGYKQIIEHLKGVLTKKEAIDQWIIKEIQYAKRQLTFMKKDPNIKWINV